MVDVRSLLGVLISKEEGTVWGEVATPESRLDRGRKVTASGFEKKGLVEENKGGKRKGDNT